jgi:SSS family solute:Na+ symporter
MLIAGRQPVRARIVLEALLGWPLWVSIVVGGAIVLGYITLGGLSSAIYNEVLQFFVILAGADPDHSVVGLVKVGGWDGLFDKVPDARSATAPCTPWGGTGSGSDNPLGANWIGIVFGLGFVLSFGYWTTNFAEVQRALSAKNISAAQRTPLIGAFPKIFIPSSLVMIPGLVAAGARTEGARDLGRPPVQQRDPAADARPAAQRRARHRGDRSAGLVHGGHGGQRLVLQHRLHVRTSGRST